MKRLSVSFKEDADSLVLAFSDDVKLTTRRVLLRHFIKRKGARIETLGAEIIDNIEQAMYEAERLLQGKVMNAVFCFPQDKITKVTGFSQRILHPKHSVSVNISDIKKAVEQARLLHLDWSYKCLHAFPFQFILDGKKFTRPPLGVHGRRLETKVIFYASKEDHVVNINKFFERVGRRCDQLVLSSLAESACFYEKELNDGNFVLLNFGREGIELSLFSDFILYDAIFLLNGGNAIDEDIGTELKMPFELAEELKISYGSLLKDDLDDTRTLTIKRAEAYREIQRGTFNSILLSSYKKIIQGLRDYLQEKEFSSKAGCVVVIGGPAKVKGFNAVLESLLGLPVNKVSSYASEFEEDAGKFLSALGALRFSVSRFNAEQSYKFPNTILRRVKNLLEEYF